MKLENHFCNLEQAKKLNELGIAQQSLFFHEFEPNEELGDRWYIPDQFRAKLDAEKYAAFDESELAVMLDAYYETYRTDNSKWAVIADGKTFETPAQASADRLIELLQNETLSAETCNKRLLA